MKQELFYNVVKNSVIIKKTYFDRDIISTNSYKGYHYNTELFSIYHYFDECLIEMYFYFDKQINKLTKTDLKFIRFILDLIKLEVIQEVQPLFNKVYKDITKINKDKEHKIITINYKGTLDNGDFPIYECE